MGAGQSVPPWQYDYNRGADYDEKGWIPPGLTYPTHYAYSTFQNHGAAAMQKDFGTGPPIGAWALGEPVVNAFGSSTVQTPGGEGWYEGIVVPKVHVQAAPAQTWINTNYVTPDTFPEGDMTAMRNAAPVVELYDGTIINTMDEWVNSLDRAYEKAYVAGGFDALQLVNEDDTSTYDPCDNPGFFEILFPIVTACGCTFVYKRYGSPIVTNVVSAPFDAAMQVGTFGFGFNLAKAFLEAYNEPSIYFKRASQFLLYPSIGALGAYAGDQVFFSTETAASETTFQAAGALVSVAITGQFVNQVAKTLENSLFFATLILGGVAFIMKGVSKLWCQLTTDSFDGCRDFDTFPKARRWDVVSIAGKLADEAREQEGWTRDDPRSEFVFRALATGPEIMMLDTKPGIPNLYEQQRFVNPLGAIYGGDWEMHPGYDITATGITWKVGSIHGWDGNVAGGLDAANNNLFACQNWDVLRHGKQQNPTPGCKRIAQRFDEWIGNWEDPEHEMGKLVLAAQNPANLLKMRDIPGWNNSLPEMQSCGTVILTTLKAISFAGRTASAQLPYTECSIEGANLWLDYNNTAYYWLSQQKAMPTVFEFWQAVQSGDVFTTEQPELSAALYAITALKTNVPNNEILRFWNQPLPQDLYNAMTAYPPPNAAFLPHGVFHDPGNRGLITKPTNLQVSSVTNLKLPLTNLTFPDPVSEEMSCQEMLQDVQYGREHSNISLDAMTALIKTYLDKGIYNGCSRCDVDTIGIMGTYLMCIVTQDVEEFINTVKNTYSWTDASIAMSMQVLLAYDQLQNQQVLRGLLEKMVATASNSGYSGYALWQYYSTYPHPAFGNEILGTFC